MCKAETGVTHSNLGALQLHSRWSQFGAKPF